MDWSTFKPIETTQSGRDFDGFSDWDQFTPIQPKPDQGDLTRGFKESFQQLPQLGYGLVAGAGAAAESAFGEGGIATGIKKAGVKGYEEWGAKIAKDAKPSDSWDYSYDQAKQGNFGALVDWLQHGIGYVGGQALQTLVTGGIGAVGGKFVAGTAAKQIAQGMVAKEAASIASTEAAKTLTTEAIAKLATANVASKFATLGQSVALGANAVGMEGGEVFGGLVSENKDRALTGSELGKAFAASLGAGALEFVGDKVGLDIMLGKSKLLKPAEFMTGKTGRLARGAIAAAGAAPIEAGTEYAQTLAEEYGKGKDPFSPESFAQARDAAALGALGGTVVGGAGGVMRGATPIAEKPPAVATDPVQPILAAGSVDDAIKAAHEAGQAWQVIAPTVPSEDVAMQRQIAQAAANLAERERIVSEREGAARSAARDARLLDVGQQWQALGITNPQDDLQAQRAGMRPTQDGPTVDLQSIAARAIPDGGAVATPSMDDGAGVGVRFGADDGRLAAGGVDQLGELPTGPVTTNELTFPFTKNESGTVLVTGDPAQIRAAFPGLSGVTKFENGKQSGVLFGTSAAPTVIAKLEQSSVKDNAQRANTEAQAAPVEAPAPVRSDAISTNDVPGAGSATVQTVGVDERLIPVSKRKPKRGRNLRTSAYDRNPLLTFLATHGLYHKKGAKDSHKSEFSPDKQIMVMGYGPVFKSTGKRLDVLAHAAIEEGYLPKDGTEAQLRELVRRAIAGEKISPMYAHGVAEQLAEQSFAEHLAQQQEAAQDEDFDDPFAPMLDGDFVADDFDVPGYDEASDPIKLEVNALLALAEDQGIDTDAIKGQAANDTYNDSEQAYYEAARSALKAAIEGSNRTSSANSGETGNAQGSQEGLTLTAPTRQDVIAQQDALDAEAKRKEEGGDKPLPRKEFTGDVPDMFNPQGSVFDVPTEPAAQATAILDAANVTGKERIDVLKDVKKGDITPDELKAAYPAKEDKFPSTAQGAIDAFNADDSAQAVAIMAKLKLDDLKEVGGAIGFRPQIGENAKAFRERIGTVADKLTLTARTQTAKEMKLYKRLTDLATEYDRIIGHRDRAIANGVTDSGSTAFKTFHNGEELTIDERIPLLVNELRLEQANPDYAKVSAMVKEARPAIFDAAKPGDSAKQEVKEVISDVGEKIGGARKDTAMSTGAKRKTAKEDDERPTWAKRFQIAQVAGGFDASVNGRDITGKWTISDTRTKDRFDQPKRMGDYFDSKEAAEAALPLIAVAQKHRVAPTGQKNAEGGYTYEIWRDVNDRKRVKVVNLEFSSRDDAMRYMTQHAQEILETNTTFGEADIPKPENTSRVGVERRTGDVKGEDFRDTFGFRGVEFGLWNNQAERQEVMNAAYDGLLDLAEVLNIPPKAIGLNGDLALAFGARGKGLSGARAHYETDRAVMNLTKMNGAGALAHEWFHALDHYFARQDGKTTAEWKINKDGTRSLDVHGGEADMASGGFKRINSGVREELRDAYTRLVRSLFTKAEQYVEDTARADKFVAVSRGELEQELSKLRRELSEQKDVRYYKRNNKPASAEQLAEFDAIAAELVEGRGLGTEWKSFPGKTKYSIQSRHTNDSLEKLNEIYKAVRGRSGFNAQRSGYLDALTGYMKRYDQRMQMLREANALTTKTRQVPTSFAMDAKSLDQGRGGDYWTSPHEMVARAFQGYVEDKIAAKNGSSPFLNYAPENAGILTPWGAKRPFPAGEERKAMNGEFDKFIGEIKTKETETGVAMYSRENQQEPLRKPLGSSTTVDALQAAIRELTGVSSLNKLGKIVATTASEIKSTWEPLIGKSVNLESEGDAGKAQAFYDPRSKTVFLIADHIRAGDETAVLAHELMHKWGQQVLGKDGWDRLHNVIGTWANADKESDEYAVYNYAKNKVAAVGAELSNQELFPYAVEAAIKMGIQPSMTAARGTVARWLESVRQNLKVVWAKITGKPETFKAQDLVNLAFGIAQMENPEYSSVAGFMANDTSAPDRGGAYSRDQNNKAENALRELSKIDDMFVYPKSDKTDMAGIIADNDPGLKFKESSYGNETLYKLTIPNVKGEAKIWVRKPNPYGPSVYSMDLVDGEATNLITERPGNNPEDVPSDTEDVYIDVSDLKEGDYGALIYNIAATYAHNTGRIFIGDPSGLSDIAMRRRLENMISTAIKFGTTDHIAPHPKQVDGNPAIGVPPLEWVYGDSVGNLERMIDVSLQSSKNAGNEEISYEPDAGNFTLTTPSGEVLAGEPGASAERLPSVPGSRRKGWRTAARAAIFNALLREEGQASSGQGRRDGLLERLLSIGNQRNDTTRQIFYSRGSSGAVQGAGAVAPNTKILGETSREYTAEQLRAMKNVGFQVEVPTLKDRAQALWKDAGKKLAQGIADQFAPVKELDKNAYGLLRLAKGATGAFEAFLRGGKLKLTDGVYDFDEANKGGVVDRLLLPLQGEHHDFLRWVAANRAERLAGEGKENLFTAQDIADIKTLADGTTSFNYTIQTGPAKGKVTRDRTLIYADANRVFNEFNRNILDLAEQSGLIDGESRKLWEHEFYVPFYRVADDADGGIRGMNIKGGVVRQQAFKQLKGGKSALNADLLDNTLMNWAHLLDAAAKNRAAKATIEAAERMGVATSGNQSTLSQMATSINNKNGVVWFMDGGQKRFSLVDDPYLMTAITSLEYAGMRNPVMNAMGTMKHWLTVGVTASPFFKVRNLIRDSVQAIGTGNLSFNPAKNLSEGWKLTDQKSDAYFRLLAGGGTIHFGTMMEGSEAKRVQALVESGVSDSTILNDEHKVKAFYRKFIEPGITAYNELGNRGEAINRAALYNQLRKQGLSHADASLQARDLMDFSMQGSFTTIRFLTQVVPFLNARIQGLYKLGKSAKEDPARFGTVIGAAAVMSIGLLAAYGDDDDWKKREEWDRNNFWWFKFGGTAFRIPKPFEIGAIATLAERGFELAFDKEMTNKRFMAQVATLLGDNLSMNPVPQLVKPILDVYSNKDSFSGRPIETMGMERVKSEYRFTDKTSMVARALGTANNAVTGVVGAEGLSPVQIDSMLRGYFGWLGSFIVGASDLIARPSTGQADRPSFDIWKAATGGMVSDLRDAPSRYVSQMYTQAKEIEQAYGTWRSLLKEGKTAEAQAFYSDNKESLAKYKNIEAVKRAEARLNERIKMIERSNMDADAKRELIRSIQQQKDRAARLVTT